MVQLLHGMQEIKLGQFRAAPTLGWGADSGSSVQDFGQKSGLFQYQATGGTFINELKNILITRRSQSCAGCQLSWGPCWPSNHIIGQLNGPTSFMDLFSHFRMRN